MSQISPPMRIVLVLAVAVMALYMLFLRPKDEVVPPAEPAPNVQTSEPAVSEPGKVAESAQEAVDAANGQLAQQEGVDGVDAGEAAAGTATETAKPGANAAAAAQPAVDVKGLPKPVAKAIRKQKVLVLLFWNGKSADDKAVHAALKDVDRWDGRVYVDSVSIKQISKYGRIARGVDVEQSPTVVVADPQLRADTLVGYVDARTIDQAVVDALRNSTGLFTSAYLKKADAVCTEHSNRIAAIPNYYTLGNSEKLDARIVAYGAGVAAFAAEFKAVKAPKNWRAYHAASVDDVAAFQSALTRFSRTVTPSSSHAAAVRAIDAFNASANPVAKRMNRRFDREGLFRCGSQF